MPLRKVRYRSEAFSDINMTNLIDIVMVLLIAFILVSNFVQTGLDIDIPEVSYVTTTGNEKIMVALDHEGRMALNGNPINREDLLPQLQELKEEYPEEQLFIRVDQKAFAGELMYVISAGKEAGFKVNIPAKLLKDTPEQ